MTTTLGGNGLVPADRRRAARRRRRSQHVRFRRDDGRLCVWRDRARAAADHRLPVHEQRAPHGQYGINGAMLSSGQQHARGCTSPGAVVRGNWLQGGTASQYPAGNLFSGHVRVGVRGCRARRLPLSVAACSWRRDRRHQHRRRHVGAAPVRTCQWCLATERMRLARPRRRSSGSVLADSAVRAGRPALSPLTLSPSAQRLRDGGDVGAESRPSEAAPRHAAAGLQAIVPAPARRRTPRRNHCRR